MALVEDTGFVGPHQSAGADDVVGPGFVAVLGFVPVLPGSVPASAVPAPVPAFLGMLGLTVCV